MKIFSVSIEGKILNAFIVAADFASASELAIQHYGRQVEGISEIHVSAVHVDWTVGAARGR